MATENLYKIRSPSLISIPAMPSTTPRRLTFTLTCPLDQWDDFKNSLERYDNLKYYLGQYEISENDYEHVQLMIGLKVKRSLTSVKEQLKIINEAIRIEEARNIFACAKYVTKIATRKAGTELITYGDIPVNLSSRSTTFKDVCIEMLSKSSFKEAKDFILQEAPDKYIMHSKQIDSFLASQYDNNVISKYTIDQFNEPPKEFPENKTLIFVGRTNIGKTAYALAHFNNPVLISDKQDFGKINPETDGIVIDDMSFNKWNPTNLVHLVDVEYQRTINIKYGAAIIPAGLKRIITLNSLALFYPENAIDVTIDAIKRRIVIHYFDDNLFGEKYQSTLDDYVIKKIKVKKNVNNVENYDNVLVNKHVLRQMEETEES